VTAVSRGPYWPVSGIPACSSPGTGSRVTAALVALIGQDDQVGSLQPGQDAPDPLGLLVMHRSGQRPASVDKFGVESA
jgi:hypothetical protein